MSGQTGLPPAKNPAPGDPEGGVAGEQAFTLTIENDMINVDVLAVFNAIITRVNDISSELTDISSCPS